MLDCCIVIAVVSVAAAYLDLHRKGLKDLALVDAAAQTSLAVVLGAATRPKKMLATELCNSQGLR